MLTIGSLFSGVGGLELGLELCGLGPVIWQCEREPFARAVLEDRWPGVSLYRDVRDIDARAARPDLICGGFPCQDVSVAGSGAGIEGGERSGLWWQFRRIVRVLRPPLVLVENVFLGWRRWLPLVRRSLWRVGYASLPLRVSAANVGAPHERARIFVLAYTNGVELRQLEQRLSGRWPRGVRDSGQAEPRGDGALDLADARGERLEVGARRGQRPGPAAAGGGALADGDGEMWGSAAWPSEPGVGRGALRARAAESRRRGGALADGDGARSPALGLAQQTGQQGAAGALADRRYPAGWQFPPGPAGINAWDGPQPAVRRAADGLSRWMDRARLQALGNAVVPFAAARAWIELAPLVPGLCAEPAA